MAVEKQSDKLLQKEEHLEIIKSSLQSSALKDGSSPFIADKEKLVFRIVDNLKVNPSTAKEYLKILESRNILQIGKREIVFFPKTIKEIKKEIKKETEDYLKQFITH